MNLAQITARIDALMQELETGSRPVPRIIAEIENWQRRLALDFALPTRLRS